MLAFEEKFVFFTLTRNSKKLKSQTCFSEGSKNLRAPELWN